MHRPCGDRDTIVPILAISRYSLAANNKYKISCVGLGDVPGMTEERRYMHIFPVAANDYLRLGRRVRFSGRDRQLEVIWLQWCSQGWRELRPLVRVRVKGSLL